MKKHRLPFIIALFLSNLVFAQSNEVVINYIETFREIAILEEIRTGVPASITLAQGIHETGAGTSKLVKSSNNHFGIKCKSDWTGPSVRHDDDARQECFRKYNDPFESYRDHSDFLKYRSHYAFLFKLDPTDYEGWAYGLKKAGYATNPKYPQILIKLIKTYNLQEYTLIAQQRIKDGDTGAMWASNNTSAGPNNNDDGIKTAVFSGKNYPTGIFRINDTKVIFVEKGTSFIKLAEEHDISLSRLFDFNDMEQQDVAVADQLFYLQRKKKTGANEFHIVAEGETLRDIAQAEGIRLDYLMSLNLLKEGMQPRAGEKLYLQKEASVQPLLASSFRNAVQTEDVPSTENTFIYHTVQPKETLYAIAKKYSVTIDDLLKWNDMQGSNLKTGQQLKINKKNDECHKLNCTTKPSVHIYQNRSYRKK